MYAEEGYELTVDLESCYVLTSKGEQFPFELDEFRRHCLLNGLDDIGLTLNDADAIHAYEAKLKVQSPWLFNAIKG
jgi:3-isopropylmalate/(R)-2-methylmalate dehydratase small subunit